MSLTIVKYPWYKIVININGYCPPSEHDGCHFKLTNTLKELPIMQKYQKHQKGHFDMYFIAHL